MGTNINMYCFRFRIIFCTKNVLGDVDYHFVLEVGARGMLKANTEDYVTNTFDSYKITLFKYRYNGIDAGEFANAFVSLVGCCVYYFAFIIISHIIKMPCTLVMFHDGFLLLWQHHFSSYHCKQLVNCKIVHCEVSTYPVKHTTQPNLQVDRLYAFSPIQIAFF